jgi:aspartyl-tRNA(Asn)/glutamyl-tRNA(Gln) amidotransferase subunit A
VLAAGGAEYDRGRQFLMPVSATGLPAIAMPTGLDRRGLPMGMQLVGRRFEEATLLRLAHAHQLASGHHRLRPSLH